jgi:hypothetical protein
MFERSREERPRRRDRLQLVAVVAEADDHRLRVEAGERLEQQVHALVEDQLAEEHDRRALLREKLGEPLGVALVR